jgi:hypothetical protein
LIITVHAWIGTDGVGRSTRFIAINSERSTRMKTQGELQASSRRKWRFKAASFKT